MNKNHRADILSLNLKDIKRSLPSVLQTKLIVSKGNKDNEPLPQNIIKPWMLTLCSQTFVSRNKVGQELLHHCRNGFVLDDPHIRKTRFYVDYHRMHDPGLKHYYTSIPVKNRLKKLELVTERNDAICSNKEFVDYLRYLDTNINYNLTQRKEFEKKRRLSEHFKKLKSEKDIKSQFAGIFRYKKRIVDNVSKAYLDDKRKLKLQKLILKKRKAIERFTRLTEEKSIHIKETYQAKLDKCRSKKEIIFQNEIKKRTEMLKTINERLDLAKKRKEYITMAKRVNKLKENIEHLKKHSSFRQEIFQKNIKLYEMYEEEQRKNVEERQKHYAELREYNENRIVKLRRAMAKKERNADMVEKFMKTIERLQAKYIKSVDPSNLDEVSRRLALLKQPFIAECVEIVSFTLQNLNIHVSSAVLAARAGRIMELQATIIPKIGISKCVFVKERVVELISHTIRHIKNDRFKTIKACWASRKIEENETVASDPKAKSHHDPKADDHKKRITVAPKESEIIGESQYSEFIGDLAGISERRLTAFYNLNEVIEREVIRFLDILCYNKLEFTPKFNSRDFVHLYAFQKHFIYKSIRRMMEYVKIKQHHFWTRTRNIQNWRLLNLNQAEISAEAAELVMNFPNKVNEFCDCVKKISKLICVQLSDKLEAENIDESDSVNERMSFLSTSDTE